ncbi:MAG: nucleotidyltransferase domain-containing protein [Chloroflexi bacterium]|nr:nucleotidyltransferase domain-containing protein [Chloroflexota bacterium]
MIPVKVAGHQEWVIWNPIAIKSVAHPLATWYNHIMNRASLTEIATLLRPIFQQYNVQRAIVFGSLAREEDTRRSDLDLIVIKETDRHFFDRYAGLLADIIDVVPGFDVDLLIYTPRELEQMMDRRFIIRAVTEGKIIYESEQEPLPV